MVRRWPVVVAFLTLATSVAYAAPIQGEGTVTVQTGKLISNSFADTDLKQALLDLSTAAGVSIVSDETVQGMVTLELKDVPLERALTLVLAPGGYSWVKGDGYYLVGKADPNSANFLRFAKTKLYTPNYMSAERIATLLPTTMAPFVKTSTGERTITITASPEMVERILEDIRLIDTPAPKIMLEALVTEVSTEVLNRYDLSFVWTKFGLSGEAEGSTFTYANATNTDVATIKALIGKGQAEVRANPRIMTLEGKEALVEVAQENYFQVATGPASYPYTTIQQIKTGISLKITPMLSSDGQITVQLMPEVSDAIGSGPGGLPINTVRRANTTVRVKDGETIVIGGMSYESKRRRRNKIPLLGDIPLLGELFTFRADETRKTEVVIMVTPRVVR